MNRRHWTRNPLIGALLLVLAAQTLLASSPARAMTEGCTDQPTFQSLADCVKHAAMMGHIDNAGVVRSLLAKVYAAGAAEARGQTLAAVAILNTFIQEVQAQSGRHINAEHACHMANHAGMVIEALLK